MPQIVFCNDYLSDAKRWLSEKEKTVQQNLTRLSVIKIGGLNTQNQKNNFFQLAYHQCSDEDANISYLAFHNDSLVFWNNYYPAFEDFIHQTCNDQTFIELKNGIYKVIGANNNAKGNIEWYALIKIYDKYILENEFLKNDFVAPLNQLLSGSPKIEVAKNPSSIDDKKILSKHGNTYLLVNSKVFSLDYQYNTLFYFYISACFFFLIAIIPYLLKKRKRISIGISLFTIILLYYFEFPSAFFNNQFNHPSLFGNADSLIFKSLAHTYIVSVLLIMFGLYAQSQSNKYLKILHLSLSVLFIFSFLFNIHQHSTFPFHLYEPALLTKESIMAFAILIVSICALIYTKFNFKFKAVSLLVLVVISLLILISIAFQASTLLWIIWGLLFIAIRLLLFQYFENRFFLKHLLTVILFALGTSLFMYQSIKDRQQNEKDILAENLVFGKDIVAESFFSTLKERIVKDKTLKNLLSQSIINTYALKQHVQQNLLNGYWERFNIELGIFDSLCFPLTPHRDDVLDNNSYYDEIIKSNGENTPDIDFFQINNSEFQYLSKIKMHNDLSKPKLFYVYLGFKSKEKSNKDGFPDLLLDKKLKLPNSLRDYDYAFYKDQRLVESFGSHNFPLQLNTIKNLSPYSIYNKNEGTSILILNKTIDFKSGLTIFSILMILYFLGLIFSLVLQRLNMRNTEVQYTLENKFQIVVAIAFTVIFCLIGYLTQTIIHKEFKASNASTLQEKTNSFATELKNKLGEQDKVELSFKDYLEYTLQNLSEIFNNDINIYSIEGDLIAASQPQLFNLNIISRKINSEAFQQLLQERSKVLYQEEKIGTLKFLSAYKCLYNNEGKLIAYINVPYFAKQSDLNDVLNSFINSILNFYTLLFVLALAGVLLFINYALRPLSIIKEKLSDINLTTHNEQIKYNSNDEVGLLVKSYNKMILQLEDKVQQLTQSERDKAWREMAKQVAHEIKNPLTPMKLQLQLLQHIKEKASAEELKIQIDKTGTTLIEQIDTLANIAEAFSNFAKIPDAKIEAVNLDEVIQSVIQLYQQDIEIDYINEVSANVKISFDKDYAIRILNNLIKNAVQAIPENRKGRIQLHTISNNPYLILSIRDNGVGISKAIKENIFKPYFTTKSSGTGLGLVMVKNMMEHCKGQIDFVSEENEGTTFTLKFVNSDASL